MGTMTESMKRNCEQLIRSRDRIRSVFPWDGGLIHLACAGIYSMKEKEVDVELLEKSKRLIKEKMGIFSNFRGTARSPIAAMLAVSGNPERTLDNGITVYELLKKEFWSSAYLPLAAMTIAQMAESFEYDKIAARTRRIYEKMKAEHPFLTSGEDSAFCAMLAMADRPDEELIDDAERCYRRLKQKFSSGNAVQSLSHVLALCEGTPEQKCERTTALYDDLKAAGRKYGTQYELPTLGILAMSDADTGKIVGEILEIDEWLSGQKGFGTLGSINKKQRLMYAGMLAQKEYIRVNVAQTAAVNSTVTLLVAQEAAICAAVAASAAASSAAASSST